MFQIPHTGMGSESARVTTLPVRPSFTLRAGPVNVSRPGSHQHRECRCGAGGQLLASGDR